MSGGNPGGAPNLVLKLKQLTHPGHNINSKRDADFAGAPPLDDTVGIKLGIKVKKGQVPTLNIKSKATGAALVLTGPLAQTDPIVADLKTALGCASDEEWAAFTTSWQKSHKVKFDTDLTLAPFDTIVNANGFQVVTIALCHDTQTFSGGVYSYAISVLPGANSSGFPLSIPLKPSKKTTPKKPKAKAKTKAKKKSRR